MKKVLPVVGTPFALAAGVVFERTPHPSAPGGPRLSHVGEMREEVRLEPWTSRPPS
jgi:hypothetical protein